MFNCNLCDQEFSRIQNLIRHVKNKHGNTALKCVVCIKSFSRSDALKRHLKTHQTPTCGVCGRSSTSRNDLEQHRKTCKPSTKRSVSTSEELVKRLQPTIPQHLVTNNQSSTHPSSNFHSTSSSNHLDVVSASTNHQTTTSSEQHNFLSTQNPTKKKRKYRKILGDSARSFTLPRSSQPLIIYLESLRSTLTEEVYDMLNLHHRVLFYITVQILYARPENWVNNGLDIDQIAYHSSNTLKVRKSSDLQVLIDKTFSSILNKVKVFIRDGSGWVIDDILPGDLLIGAHLTLQQEDESN